MSRSQAPLPPASSPLRCPADALAVAHHAFSHHRRGETLALVLDHAHRGGLVVAVDGASAADEVLHVGEVVLRTGGFGALVLATRRSSPVGAADEDAWFELRARCEEAGVVLLDWFVQVGHTTVSLRERTVSRSWWLADTAP